MYRSPEEGGRDRTAVYGWESGCVVHRTVLLELLFGCTVAKYLDNAVFTMLEDDEVEEL